MVATPPRPRTATKRRVSKRMGNKCDPTAMFAWQARHKRRPRDTQEQCREYNAFPSTMNQLKGGAEAPTTTLYAQCVDDRMPERSSATLAT